MKSLFAVALALVLVAPAPGFAAGAPSKSALPFIADDYAQALAQARKQNRPLFIEIGAPWCHTCRSMKAFVFSDASLARETKRFVWLDIDTEKAQNAPFRKQFPVEALPTFLVVESTHEKPVLRWVGSMNLAQVRAFLDAGEAAARAAATDTAEPAAGDAEAWLRHADRLYGAADYAAAAGAYHKALAVPAPALAKPAAWPSRARAIEASLFALDRAGEYETGAKLAVDSHRQFAGTPSGANIAATGVFLAVQIPAEAPGRAQYLQTLERAARDALADESLDIAADDRSGVFGAVITAREDAKDSTGVHEWTARWADFLDSAAAKAPTAEARAVFDSHRLSAALDLGDPERVVAALQQSERDLPQDYNPPARLATAYKAMKSWDLALAASDRALAKAYGPRRIGMLQTRADIYKGRGEVDAARKTLGDALREAEAMPPGQRSETQIASLKKKIDAMQVP